MDPKYQPTTISNAKLDAGPTSHEDLGEQVQSIKPPNIVDLPTEIIEQISEMLEVEEFESRRKNSRDPLLDFRLSHTKLAAQSQRIFFKRYFKTIRAFGFLRSRFWDRLCHLSGHDLIPISAHKLELTYLDPNVGLEDKDTAHELKSVLGRFKNLRELCIRTFGLSIRELAKSFRFPTLTRLKVDACGGEVEDYVEVLKNQPALAAVEFEYCKLYNGCWNDILTAASLLPHLRCFYIDRGLEGGEPGCWACFHPFSAAELQIAKPQSLHCPYGDPFQRVGSIVPALNLGYKIEASNAEDMHDALTWMGCHHSVRDYLGALRAIHL
jgi:hypothetical protein